MRAVWVSFLQMLVYMRRDRMLFAACLALLLAGILFRFGPLLEAALTEWLHRPALLAPYYALMDIFLAMLPPAMFCFVSAMVCLEEADERTAAYLFITPLGRNGYLVARLGVPAAAAFLVTAALLPACKLTALSPVIMAGLAAGGALQGIMIALLILTLSSNKLEGMAVSKLSSLMILGAAVPFFIKGNVQYALLFLPSFWIGKAVCENRLPYILPAFALAAVWLRLLLRRYLRKI